MSKTKTIMQLPRYPLQVSSRAFAAIVGGYALTNLVAIGLAGVLPTSRAEAVMTAMVSSFLIYTLCIIWVFAARSAWRAWLGLAVSGALCGGLILILKLGSKL